MKKTPIKTKTPLKTRTSLKRKPIKKSYKKHRETQFTDIDRKVKEEVHERDHYCCVVCGKQGLPNSHIIRRSQGGLGIKENIVTHCLRCHTKYDSGDIEVRTVTKDYIRKLYPDFSDEQRRYKKWQDQKL